MYFIEGNFCMLLINNFRYILKLSLGSIEINMCFILRNLLLYHMCRNKLHAFVCIINETVN